MQTNFESSRDLTSKAIAHLKEGFDLKGEEHQIKVSTHPIIANAMYAREKEVIGNERLKTLTKLARNLEDDELEKMVGILGYKVIVSDEKNN